MFNIIKTSDLCNLIIFFIVLFSAASSFFPEVSSCWAATFPFLSAFLIPWMGAIYMGNKDKLKFGNTNPIIDNSEEKATKITPKKETKDTQYD